VGIAMVGGLLRVANPKFFTVCNLKFVIKYIFSQNDDDDE